MSDQKQRQQFERCIEDLVQTKSVTELKDIPLHLNQNCYEHSLFVAYMSYTICSRFGWDYVSAARGGLLHDLYLYNWRDKDSHEGLHGFTHPKVALKNAQKLCPLNKIEENIIVRHMWPLTTIPPRYKEAFVVSFADKVCALVEISRLYHRLQIRQKLAFAL